MSGSDNVMTCDECTDKQDATENKGQGSEITECVSCGSDLCSDCMNDHECDGDRNDGTKTLPTEDVPSYPREEVG